MTTEDGRKEHDWLGADARQILKGWERAAAHFHDVTKDTAATMKRHHGPLVGVFGSAREPERARPVFDKYGASLTRLGEEMGRRGLGAVTGGCPGVPMAVELGLRATRLHVGVQTIYGIRIRFTGTDFEDREPDSPTVDFMLNTETFGTRIELMEAATEGCILGPGGIGTDTEGALFRQVEQLRHLTGRGGPMIFFGVDFWRPVRDRLASLARKWSVAGRDEIRMLLTDNVEEAVASLLAHNGNAERARIAMQLGRAMTEADRSRADMSACDERDPQRDQFRLAHEAAKEQVRLHRDALAALAA